MPSMRAMPAGSFTPASPSRIVPVRPGIVAPPSTENITAGSVGARAAPSTPASFHEKPSTRCAATASRPAVTKVPSTPIDSTGQTDWRMRGQPMSMPPLRRIATSATTAIRSTVCTDTVSGQIAPAPAAASRNTPGAGTGSRVDAIAAASPRATARRISA